MEEKKIICAICGKEILPKEAYTFKDGTVDNCHKKCRTTGCYDNQPWTYFPLMKLFNIPYIEDQWLWTVRYQIRRALRTGEYKSAFGKYLAKMKLFHWKRCGWEDSPHLNSSSNLSENKKIRLFLLDFCEEAPQEYFDIIGQKNV
jgi:hypothetical protein